MRNNSKEIIIGDFKGEQERKGGFFVTAEQPNASVVHAESVDGNESQS